METSDTDRNECDTLEMSEIRMETSVIRMETSVIWIETSVIWIEASVIWIETSVIRMETSVIPMKTIVMGWKKVLFFSIHLLTNFNASNFAYFSVSFVDEKQQNYNAVILTRR